MLEKRKSLKDKLREQYEQMKMGNVRKIIKKITKPKK